MDTQNFFII